MLDSRYACRCTRNVDWGVMAYNLEEKNLAVYIVITNGLPLVIFSGLPLLLTSGIPFIVISGLPLVSSSGLQLIISNGRPLIITSCLPLVVVISGLPLVSMCQRSTACHNYHTNCHHFSGTPHLFGLHSKRPLLRHVVGI